MRKDHAHDKSQDNEPIIMIISNRSTSLSDTESGIAEFLRPNEVRED